VKYLRDELQKIAERVFRNEARKYDLIINVPPGSTKSTICSLLFHAWIFSRMPSARIICASVNNDLAERFSNKTRTVLNSELYRRSFPEVRLERKTRTRLWTTVGGERQSFRVMSNVTGQHAHFIIIDDPINPSMSMSDKGLAVVNDWMDTTISTRRIITDKVVTPTILIMQRLHQNDPTGHWLEKHEDDGTVKHICLPADLLSKNDVKPAGLRKYYRGNLLDPVRFDFAFLGKQRKTLGEYAYACQYDQSPIPRGLGFFDVSQIRCRNAPHPDSFVQLCRFWDKAASVGKGDYTAGVLMGRTHDQSFWILDVIRGRWNSSDREAIMRRTAERDGEHVVVGLERERDSGGVDSRNMTIRNLAGFVVKSVPINGTKEQRADPFSTQVNAGNVFCQAAAWNKDFLEELQYFPFGTHDDQVDASAGAFRLVLSYEPAEIVCSDFSFV
jgi:predicted phage terminase large subunit-like protein